MSTVRWKILAITSCWILGSIRRVALLRGVSLPVVAICCGNLMARSGCFLILSVALLAIASVVILALRLLVLVVLGRTGWSRASLVVVHRHVAVDVGEDLSAH